MARPRPTRPRTRRRPSGTTSAERRRQRELCDDRMTIAPNTYSSSLYGRCRGSDTFLSGSRTTGTIVERSTVSENTFGSRRDLAVGDRQYSIFALSALDHLDVEHLPYSLKILLENLLRNEDGVSVTAMDVEALATWDPTGQPHDEIAFSPARILMQDFTGVPAVVDL